MPRVSYNSVGGYSTGLTMTNVIDDLGNITGVGATFSGLIRANAGISAAGGVTFSNAISVDRMNIGRGAGGTAINYGSVAIGGGAQDVLANNTTGIENTAVGIGALQDTISGSNNVAVGAYAAQGNYTSSSNTAVGSYALNAAGGSQNTAVGYYSLGSHGGNNNVALGYLAGRYRSTGTSSLTTGTGGIYIGYQARASLANRTNEIVIGTDALGLGSNTAVIGATAQTAATIYGLMNLPGGLSASGITVGGSIVLQNQEFIRNTTNGRMDFMPAPAGSTQFGMYMDFTSWSYGVKLGTIRASDNATNAAGFLWEAPLTINGDVNFNLGSNGQNGLVNSTIGNNTNQFYTNTSSGENSGAFAIVDSAGVGAANRSPGVTHTNPNLYVYRSGTARATDFIRMEHDGTVGRIVSGGTSGISLEPGSGSVGISGSISSVDGTFGGNVYTDNIFDNTGVLSINDKTNTRVAIGDYSSNANSTFIYLRDNISTLYISNPFGVISLGDPNGIDNSNVITYDTPNATFSGNGLNSLDGFQTISADSTILENNRRVTTNARSWFL